MLWDRNVKFWTKPRIWVNCFMWENCFICDNVLRQVYYSTKNVITLDFEVELVL